MLKKIVVILSSVMLTQLLAFDFGNALNQVITETAKELNKQNGNSNSSVAVNSNPVKSSPVNISPDKEPEKIVDGRVYNKAFFDIKTKNQAPLLDYINFSKRASFDVNHYANSVSKIKEGRASVLVHGRIEVPAGITTKKVYINCAGNYYRQDRRSKKAIYYNGSKKRQTADDFIVDVETDNKGNKYISYKISYDIHAPSKMKAGESRYAPNVYHFKVAPYKRGYQNKFQKAKIYIIED